MEGGAGGGDAATSPASAAAGAEWWKQLDITSASERLFLFPITTIVSKHSQQNSTQPGENTGQI